MRQVANSATCCSCTDGCLIGQPAMPLPSCWTICWGPLVQHVLKGLQLSAGKGNADGAGVAQGEVRLRLGKSREGVEAYEKALQAAPDQTVALLQGLTRALAQDGRNKVLPALAFLISRLCRARMQNALSIGLHRSRLHVAVHNMERRNHQL